MDERPVENVDAVDHTRAMGTRSIPVKATDPAAAPERDEAIARLERGLRTSRIAIGVLAAAVVLLLAAVILLASGVLSPAPTPVVPGNGVTEGVTGGDAGQSDGRPGADDSDNTSSGETTHNSSNGATGSDAAIDTDQDDADREPARPLRAADIVDIVGEKWSNAQKILEALGVDVNDLVVLTNDGDRVIDPSNWTVTRVADLDAENAVAVYLRHDTDPNPLGWVEDLFSE